MKITFNLLLLFTQKKKRKESKQHSHYFLFPPIISWWFWQIFREQQVLKVNSNHRLIDAISIRGLYFVIKLLIQPTSYTRTEQKNDFYYDLFGWREKKKFSGTFLLEMLSNETWIFDLWEFFMITKSFWEIFEEFRWVQMVWIEVF